VPQPDHVRTRRCDGAADALVEFMPMTPIQDLQREIHRDRRNTHFTAVLVLAVILLIALAWSTGR
jgi:hypothetical protein